MQVQASDLVAQIVSRVQNVGVNANGVQFSAIKMYSPSWLRQKKKSGRYKGIVDFTYSGNMLKDFKVIKTESAGGEWNISIDFENEESISKAEANAALRGTFTEPSEAESESARAAFEGCLLAKIQKYLLG